MLLKKTTIYLNMLLKKFKKSKNYKTSNKKKSRNPEIFKDLDIKYINNFDIALIAVKK